MGCGQSSATDAKDSSKRHHLVNSDSDKSPHVVGSVVAGAPSAAAGTPPVASAATAGGKPSDEAEDEMTEVERVEHFKKCTRIRPIGVATERSAVNLLLSSKYGLVAQKLCFTGLKANFNVQAEAAIWREKGYPPWVCSDKEHNTLYTPFLSGLGASEAKPNTFPVEVVRKLTHDAYACGWHTEWRHDAKARNFIICYSRWTGWKLNRVDFDDISKTNKYQTGLDTPGKRSSSEGVPSSCVEEVHEEEHYEDGEGQFVTEGQQPERPVESPHQDDRSNVGSSRSGGAHSGAGSGNLMESSERVSPTTFMVVAQGDTMNSDGQDTERLGSSGQEVVGGNADSSSWSGRSLTIIHYLQDLSVTLPPTLSPEDAAKFDGDLLAPAPVAGSEVTESLSKFLAELGVSNAESSAVFKLYVLGRILSCLPQDETPSSIKVSLELDPKVLTLYDVYTLDHATPERLQGDLPLGVLVATYHDFTGYLWASECSTMKELRQRLSDALLQEEQKKQKKAKSRMLANFRHQRDVGPMQLEHLSKLELVKGSTLSLLLEWSVENRCTAELLSDLALPPGGGGETEMEAVPSHLPTWPPPPSLQKLLRQVILEGDFVRATLGRLLSTRLRPIDAEGLISSAVAFLAAYRLFRGRVPADGFTLVNREVLFNVATAPTPITAATQTTDGRADGETVAALTVDTSSDDLTPSQLAHLCVVAIHEFAHFSRMHLDGGAMTDTKLAFGGEDCGESGCALERALNYGELVKLRTAEEEQLLLGWDGCSAWPLPAPTVRHVRFVG